MEEELKSLSKSLGGFCNHLQSSCDAFNHSLLRRPIPLDSASSTFIQSLNRRLSTAGPDLNFLESMSFGTVSFEELLGHCNQIYKRNQEDILHLQDRLTDFGYIPEIEIDEASDKESSFRASGHEDPKNSDDDLDPPSFQRSIVKGLEEDVLLDVSLNLKNLGLSDACLATLASEVNDTMKDPDTSWEESAKGKAFGTSASPLPAPKASELSRDAQDEDKTLVMGGTSGRTITVSKIEYEDLPPYMKSLASWEDLVNAVEKFNLTLGSKMQTNGSYYFRADEIQSLGLGNKEKAYTLLLMRMKRLMVETSDGGVISYRVV